MGDGVPGLDTEAESELFEVIDAVDAMRFGFRLVEGWQQEKAESGGDGEDDHEVESGESDVALWRGGIHGWVEEVLSRAVARIVPGWPMWGNCANRVVFLMWGGRDGAEEALT
ncbi:MAG: hypothetical protein RI897_3766 [Verrucomicrobiota bacterium]